MLLWACVALLGLSILLATVLALPALGAGYAAGHAGGPAGSVGSSR
jgi:hypothetical protein